MTEDEKLAHIDTSIDDAFGDPAEDVLTWFVYHKWRRVMLLQCGES